MSTRKKKISKSKKSGRGKIPRKKKKKVKKKKNPFITTFKISVYCKLCEDDVFFTRDDCVVHKCDELSICEEDTPIDYEKKPLSELKAIHCRSRRGDKPHQCEIKMGLEEKKCSTCEGNLIGGKLDHDTLEFHECYLESEEED